MTIHIRRQISIRTAQGIITSLPSGIKFPFRLTDVDPSYVVNVVDGGFTSNSVELNASDTYTVPVPVAYLSANRLACFFRSTSTFKVAIVDPEIGDSTFLVKSSNGTTKGDHKGILMWQGRVTSITISVPAAFDDAIIDYFLWNIPDLTVPASWQMGNQTLGVIT